MKRILWLLLPLCLLLCACAPAKGVTETGLEWNPEAWQTVGPLLGVEKVSGDLHFSEYIDDHSGQGLYYAAWITLDSQAVYNEAGEESPTYPAAAFVMLQETFPGNSNQLPENPEAVVQTWLEAASGYYQLGEPISRTAGTQEFQLHPITPAGDSPYDHGYYATAVHGDFAISVELMCLPGCYPDAESLMMRFLRGIHYRDLR